MPFSSRPGLKASLSHFYASGKSPGPARQPNPRVNGPISTAPAMKPTRWASQAIPCARARPANTTIRLEITAPCSWARICGDHQGPTSPGQGVALANAPQRPKIAPDAPYRRCLAIEVQGDEAQACGQAAGEVEEQEAGRSSRARRKNLRVALPSARAAAAFIAAWSRPLCRKMEVNKSTTAHPAAPGPTVRLPARYQAADRTAPVC